MPAWRQLILPRYPVICLGNNCYPSNRHINRRQSYEKRARSNVYAEIADALFFFEHRPIVFKRIAHSITHPSVTRSAQEISSEEITSAANVTAANLHVARRSQGAPTRDPRESSRYPDSYTLLHGVTITLRMHSSYFRDYVNLSPLCAFYLRKAGSSKARDESVDSASLTAALRRTENYDPTTVAAYAIIGSLRLSNYYHLTLLTAASTTRELQILASNLIGTVTVERYDGFARDGGRYTITRAMNRCGENTRSETNMCVTDYQCLHDVW